MSNSHSLLAMVTGSGPVVQGVLILLVLLSIGSWAIVIAKVLEFRKAQAESDRFSSVFWGSRNFARIDESSRTLTTSPLARVFGAGFKELSQLLVEREQGEVDQISFGSLEQALRRAEFQEACRLEKGVTFLATVASAAPFIGLFGTVWGIMNAFHSLGTAGTTTIQAVAPGISEALIATAIGLGAAIPAAVAYNYFAVIVKRFKQSMNRFSEEFLTIASEHFI